MVEQRETKHGIEDAGLIASEIAAAVTEALAHDAPGAAADLVRTLKAPDVADVIEQLTPDNRVALIQALGTSFDYEVLSELDETVRDQLSEALPNDLLARAVTELDTDDAAYVIESLEESDKQEILAQLPSGDREALERALDYPEDSAGRLMQADFVAVAPYWTVGNVNLRRRPGVPRIGLGGTLAAAADQARCGRQRDYEYRPAYGAGDRRPGGACPPVPAL